MSGSVSGCTPGSEATLVVRTVCQSSVSAAKPTLVGAPDGLIARKAALLSSRSYALLRYCNPNSAVSVVPVPLRTAARSVSDDRDIEKGEGRGESRNCEKVDQSGCGEDTRTHFTSARVSCGTNSSLWTVPILKSTKTSASSPVRASRRSSSSSTATSKEAAHEQGALFGDEYVYCLSAQLELAEGLVPWGAESCIGVDTHNQLCSSSSSASIASSASSTSGYGYTIDAIVNQDDYDLFGFSKAYTGLNYDSDSVSDRSSCFDDAEEGSSEFGEHETDDEIDEQELQLIMKQQSQDF